MINDGNNFIGISENEYDAQRDGSASVHNRCHICSSSVSIPDPVLKILATDASLSTGAKS